MNSSIKKILNVRIHNTIFVIQNGVKRNEESIENQ